MATVLLEAAASPAITYDLAHDHLRLIDDSERALVELYIRAALDATEIETKRSLASQKFLYVADEFPDCDEICLEKPPLISVESVKYVDPAGVLRTLDSSWYTVDTYSKPGRIALNVGYRWPVTLCGANAVQVTYQAGHSAAQPLPDGILQAALFLLTHYYTNRIPITQGGSINEVPETFKAICLRYRS